MAHVDLHHRLDGAGPRVVLLHPVGLDHTFFDTLAADLSEHFLVLRVDLRGHGRSPMEPVTSLDDYADDVHALLRRLDWTATAMIGFSFGGMLTQIFALRYPSLITALVIAAAPATLSAELRPLIAERGALAEREGMIAVLEPTLARWFTASFREQGGDRPVRQRLLSNDVSAWSAAWRAMADIDTAPRLSSIEFPTLCLAGEQDVSVPPHVVEAISMQIPGAEFKVIPSTPHMLFIERPAPVHAVISGFLERVLGASV
jgi:3-oxoadipate enol-lactonase